MNMKRRTHGISWLSVVLAVFFVLAGFHNVTAQKRFLMNQQEAQKFKIAKQLFQKGRDFMSKNKLQMAEKYFKDCLGHFPKFSHADYALAQIYYQHNNIPLALDHITRAKITYPELAKLGADVELEYIAQLRQERERLKQVIMEVDQQLKNMEHMTLSPEQRRQMWVDLTDRKAKAENTMRQIDEKTRKPVAKTTDIPADFYYMHGNVFFKAKRFMDALKQYQEAIRLDPAHGGAYNNLANLHFMARKYQKALFYLDKAESNGFKVKPQFRETIKQSMKQQ